MADHENEKKDESKGQGGHGHSGGHGGGHGGGGHEEAHEGAPEWLISFADNVTLMMGFFVILLAMNMAKTPASASSGAGEPSKDGKTGAATTAMLDAAIAIREGFNNPVNIYSNNPNELPLIRRVLERAQEDGFALDAGIKGKKHSVQAIRPGDYRKPCGAVWFSPGSTTLTPAGRESAMSIANHFRGLRTILEVRGHVSSAEAYGSAEKGMRLSFDRAAAVAAILAANGLDWRQLRIVSCGDNDRVKAIAYDKAGQQQNERVEVVPTDLAMPVYTPEGDETPAVKE
jgi:chemotaxis protein MotB